MEMGLAELNERAGKVADPTSTEELWDTLVDQEARVTKLEEEKGKAGGDPDNPCRACTMGSMDPRLQVLGLKMQTLEGLAGETQEEMRQSGRSQTRMARKPISANKVIQSISP